MDNISSFLRTMPVERKRVTQRGELLQYFVDEINKGRKGTEYKPVGLKYVAWKVTGIPTGDLYALVSKMKDGARRGVPPSAIFYSELKAKV